MFDPNRMQERLNVIKSNLRAFANTQCTGADELLRRDDLLDQCIMGSLEAYDQELQSLSDDRDAWAKRGAPQ